MGIERNCCGLSLKHATIIIGIVQAIMSFMSMILSAAYVQSPHELIDMADPSVVPDPKVLKAILIICTTISALQCVFSILIIFGAETNRPVLLMPWLTYNPIFVFTYLIATLIAIIHHTGMNNTPFVIGHIVFSGIFSVIFAWKILTVYRFYKHLKSLNF